MKTKLNLTFSCFCLIQINHTKAAFRRDYINVVSNSCMHPYKSVTNAVMYLAIQVYLEAIARMF